MNAQEEIAEGIKIATDAVLRIGVNAKVELATKHYTVFCAWSEPTKLIFEVENKPFES